MIEEKAEIIGKIIAIVILLFLVNGLGTWLWGVIAVTIFGLPTLTYWQFMGLSILIGILFGKIKIGGDN